MSDYKLEAGISETLSAFLDGEASPEEMHALLEQLNRDPRLHAVLDRYHRLRASLRGEWHPALGAGFAERVLAGIGHAGHDTEPAPGTGIFPAKRRLQPWMRGTLGLAMAASLAAVVVLAARVLLPAPAEPTLTARIETARNPAMPAARTSPGTVTRNRDYASQPWNDLSPDAAAELNNYLISHNNSAVGHGWGGSMGFMRVAAGDGVAFRDTGDTER